MLSITSLGVCKIEDSVSFTQGNIKLNVVRSESISHDLIKLYMQLNIELKPRWYIYGNTPQPLGKPTEIGIDDTENQIESFHIYWPETVSETMHDGTIIHKYHDYIEIPIVVEIKNNAPIHIAMIINYVLCNELCIPQSNILNLKITDKNLSHTDGITHTHMKHDNTAEIYTIALILLLAFLGGIALNLTPYSFPILSLKLLSFAYYKDQDIKWQLYALISGVMAIFICLALLAILLQSYDNIIDIGMYFQNPYFIITLIIALCAMIYNAGYLMPHTADHLNKILPYDISGMIPSFFSGVIASILSIPCMAPLLGGVISFAFTQSTQITLITFVMIGIGMSFPYMIFILYPSTLYNLLKSQQITQQCTKLLILISLISIIWLCYTLSYHVGSIPIIILCILLVGAKFIIKKAQNFKLLCILIMIAITYSLPQFKDIGNMTTNNHAANDELIWENFQYDLINYYVSQGNIVIVDITAPWCLTCQYNKFKILNSKQVKNLFKTNNVKLLRGNLTNNKPDVENYLHLRNRYGIPYNTAYGPSAPYGINLNIILTAQELETAIKQCLK